MNMSSDAQLLQGAWLLKQRANIRTWRRFWTELLTSAGRATLRFSSSREAAQQAKHEKETDVTGYILRGDAAKAGFYFECYKGSDKLHFFRAESADAFQNWMAVFRAAGLAIGPSLDALSTRRALVFSCWKRGGGAKSSAWRQRWLRICDREIRYWDSETDDAPPNGSVDVVQSMLILDANVDRSAGPALHVLRVGVIGREYVFGFEDALERERFLKALESCGGVLDAHAVENMLREGEQATPGSVTRESIRQSMLQNSVLIGGSDDDAGKENALDMPIRTTVTRVTAIMEGPGSSHIAELHSRYKELTSSSSAWAISRLRNDFKAAAEALPHTSANAIFARAREEELRLRLVTMQGDGTEDTGVQEQQLQQLAADKGGAEGQ